MGETEQQAAPAAADARVRPAAGAGDFTLRIVVEDRRDDPIVVPLPDPSLLAAETISLETGGNAVRMRVVARQWQLRSDASWLLTIVVARPPGSFWAWAERLGPGYEQGIAFTATLLTVLVPGLLALWISQAPLWWLGRLIANLDVILAVGGGIAVMTAAVRAPYKWVQRYLGGISLVVGVLCWQGLPLAWPEFFDIDEAGFRALGAAAWESRGEIAAVLGGWAVAGLTLARLFGVNASGTMAAAAWLEKRKGTAPAPKGVVERFLASWTSRAS